MSIFNATAPSGGGGAEIETGTWSTSSSQSSTATITFTKTHKNPPIYASIALIGGQHGNTNTMSKGVYAVDYVNSDRTFGGGNYISSSTRYYGRVCIRYRPNSNSSSVSNMVANITQPYTSTGSTTGYEGYWVTNTGMTLRTTSGSYFYVQNSTNITAIYDWIAIWAPEN